MSDPEAFQQGPARECRCYPWSGLRALHPGSREILAAETGPEVTHGAGIPPACGAADGAQGHGSSHAAERNPRAKGAGVGGKGGGQWTRPPVPALDTLSLVATLKGGSLLPVTSPDL